MTFRSLHKNTKYQTFRPSKFFLITLLFFFYCWLNCFLRYNYRYEIWLLAFYLLLIFYLRISLFILFGCLYSVCRWYITDTDAVLGVWRWSGHVQDWRRTDPRSWQSWRNYDHEGRLSNYESDNLFCLIIILVLPIQYFCQQGGGFRDRSFCLCVIQWAGLLTEKVISWFHWKLVLWLGLHSIPIRGRACTARRPRPPSGSIGHPQKDTCYIGGDQPNSWFHSRDILCEIGLLPWKTPISVFLWNPWFFMNFNAITSPKRTPVISGLVCYKSLCDFWMNLTRSCTESASERCVNKIFPWLGLPIGRTD